MIPRSIHQTYKSKRLPGPYDVRHQKLLNLHPGWKVSISDDEECRALVAAQRPDLLSFYDGFETVIQRTDMWRIVVLQSEGGFYADMDIDCHRCLDELRTCQCVFAEEKTLRNPQDYGHRHALRIANYMMGARAGHPFLESILCEMRRSIRPIKHEEDVLESTGPGLVTRVYHEYPESRADVMLLPSPDVRCVACGGLSCQFGEYASHHHLGSWRWN